MENKIKQQWHRARKDQVTLKDSGMCVGTWMENTFGKTGEIKWNQLKEN